MADAAGPGRQDEDNIIAQLLPEGQRGNGAAFEYPQEDEEEVQYSDTDEDFLEVEERAEDGRAPAADRWDGSLHGLLERTCARLGSHRSVHHQRAVDVSWQQSGCG